MLDFLDFCDADFAGYRVTLYDADSISEELISVFDGLVFYIEPECKRTEMGKVDL